MVFPVTVDFPFSVVIVLIALCASAPVSSGLSAFCGGCGGLVSASFGSSTVCCCEEVAGKLLSSVLLLTPVSFGGVGERGGFISSSIRFDGVGDGDGDATGFPTSILGLGDTADI